MRRWTFIAASALWIVFATVSVVAEGDNSQAPLLEQRARVRWINVPRQVLAFYYGWYASPQVSKRWFHWENIDVSGKHIGNCTHFPLLGTYDSHDPQLVEQHCRQAKAAGVSGFIASWWAEGDFHDQGMPLLLDTAQKVGLKVTIYFETTHPGHGSPRENALRDVLYLLENYASHPAWLKVNGKPVLFVYGRAVGEVGLDGWLWIITEANRRYPGGAVFIGDQISRPAAHVFDGIHTYNITGSTAGQSVAAASAWARSAFPGFVKTAGANRIACVTIIPGYDDSKLGRPTPRPVTERHDGSTYRALWQEAMAANPDWVLITSWNEWHEGSEIEASVENGARELRTNAEWATRFLALPPRVPLCAAGAVSDRERLTLRDRLRKLSIAILPGGESEGLWFLQDLGVELIPVTWEMVVDTKRFNPQQFPVVLYAGGEEYPAQAHKPDDVPRALHHYVEKGGILLVLPSGPKPFHYDSTRKRLDGQATAVGHDRLIGLPLQIAWEQPPATGLKFAVESPKFLPTIPQQFAFPVDGDRRWRPVEKGANITPLLTLRDGSGRSLGTACAVISVGDGRIVYSWFRLLEMTEGQSLLYDLCQLTVQQANGHKH